MQEADGVKIDVSAYEKMLPGAISHFWTARKQATSRQKKKGVSDQGNRAGVTAGKNMDGFISMAKKLILANGLKRTEIFTNGRIELTLPGYYRPTNNWDLLAVSGKELVAAIEFKSQVGPSFGNNFNNRVEEAIGNAVDINTAFREGAFGESGKPFIGYFFVLEDCEASTRPVKFTSPHFPALPEFDEASYAKRYEIFCRRLVQERLYDAAGLLLTERSKGKKCRFRIMSKFTDPSRFVNQLAGKIAAISLEQRNE